MATVVVVFVIGAAVILGLALFSDRRDRRLGIDTKVRVQDVARRRHDQRQERVDRRVRRYLPDDAKGDPHRPR